jgi:2-polyprenyl-6-methoxyphenol hydroxylase-like FAD-dependent oxidoreductase
MDKKHWERAIVMGSGVAGLLAARVLSDFFQEVVLIERDAHLTGSVFRQGVPQERHIHTLLARGRNIIERLYPGFDGELAAIGAPLLHWGKDTRILSIGGYLRQVDLGISARGHSRPTLEWVLRRRTAQIDNVIVRSGCEIAGLIVENDIVRGIRFRDRDEQQVRADFLIDAMGRNSKSVHWLKDLSYPMPPETNVDPLLGYATRWYRLPQNTKLDIPAVLIQPGAIPGLNRGAAAGMVEDQKVIVTLAGMSGDYPPTDEAGFMAFARSLPDRTIEQWIGQLEPITPIYGYRATNRLRHYERLKNYPDRFIAIGDATCTLNPIYGQGMTLAAMQAEMLQQELLHVTSLDGFARRFHRHLAKVNRIPWLLATSEDRRFPLTEGTPPNILERIMHVYLIMLFRAAAHDIYVAQSILKTMHFVMHPVGLFQPRIIMGMLLSLRRKRKLSPPFFSS